ncbi:MAG: hypothetical protein ACPG31_12810, partial [Planctomycetota bacterium]
QLKPGEPRSLHIQKITHTGAGGRLPIGGVHPEDVHLSLRSVSPSMLGKPMNPGEISWSARQDPVPVSADGTFAWHNQLPGWKTLTASWSPKEGEIYVVQESFHLDVGQFLDLGTLRVGSGPVVELSLSLVDRGGEPIDLADPRLPTTMLEEPLLIQGMEIGEIHNRTGVAAPEFYLSFGEKVRVHGLPPVRLRFWQVYNQKIANAFERENRLRPTNMSSGNLTINVADVGLEDRFVIMQEVKNFGEESVTLRLLNPVGGFQSGSHFEAFLLSEGRVVHKQRLDLDRGDLAGSALEFPMQMNRSKEFQLLIWPTNTREPRRALPPNQLFHGPVAWSDTDPLRFDALMEEGVVFTGKALFEDGTPVTEGDFLLVHLLGKGVDPNVGNRGGRPQLMVPILDDQGSIYLPGLPPDSVFFGSFRGKELSFETSDVDTTDAIVTVKKTPYPH